ncbi:MAG: endonuclease/exonuclease/phosphatase family protein [Alistipes sp.]|nr:endonuclease/exonuclease/phosphatase family protein [Alistipes sp.]MBQ8652120.1 endonuclease/exonuclease/phosphatase family protein [Alistipes sp.]
MANYDTYYTDYGGGSKAARPSLVMILVDLALTLLSVVVFVMLLTALIVSRIDPEYTWALPMLGLIAPWLYLLTIILALYWVVRWRLKRAALMAFACLIGLFSVSLFWRPDAHRKELQRKYDKNFSYSKRAFKVLSYNVRFFYDDAGESSADSVAAFLERVNPDVVCLQEYYPDLAARSERLMRLVEEYNTVQFDPGEGNWHRQAILSRYKVLRSGVIMRPTKSIWADLLIREDTVRVVNSHLQSTGITAFDSEYLTGHAYLLDTAREEKLRSIVSRFHDNCVVRADEADTIRGHLDSLAPRMQILCGDFNDTPLSYTYRRLARGLNDAFSEAGEGYSHTFRGFFDVLRIDYVLSSDHFETLSYEVPKVPHSDHLPVLVRLVRREE